MAHMTHRKRLLRVINHKEADRVPIDIGGTTATCINVKAYEALKTYLDLTDPYEKPDTISRISLTAIPSEEILQKLDIDCRGLNLGHSDNPADQDVDYPDGTFVDQWGIRWRRGAGVSSYYHDIDSTLRHDNATIEDLNAWKIPDPNDPGRFRGLREKAQACIIQSPCVIYRKKFTIVCLLY